MPIFLISGFTAVLPLYISLTPTAVATVGALAVFSTASGVTLLFLRRELLLNLSQGTYEYALILGRRRITRVGPLSEIASISVKHQRPWERSNFQQAMWVEWTDNRLPPFVVWQKFSMRPNDAEWACRELLSEIQVYWRELPPAEGDDNWKEWSFLHRTAL